ncbi:MAG: ATP-binding protein [Candidatus Paceibacterota bacterium]
MELVSFSIKNYRSISKAYKLPLTDYSVFVGPNNEGKSNILKALGLSLNLLSGGSRLQRTRYRGTLRYYYRNADRFDYNWFRDFPINLQSSKEQGTSDFTLEFTLDQNEQANFKKTTKLNLSTNLKVKLSISKENIVFDVLVPGKAKKGFQKKRSEIADFISDSITAKYVPPIRTSELAVGIVENILESELQELESDPKFQRIIKDLEKLQKPIIESISKNLTKTITNFIPDVNKISIENRTSLSRVLSASCELYVDDGIKSELKSKGDGVISLTALSMIRHASEKSLGKKKLILLVEEPESHLHPKAINGLKTVLKDISNKHQVIISTHSPVIIDRERVSGNLIVENNKANAAKNLQEIRDSLGIQLSDNLSGAYLVLLVEGEGDETILKSWIRSKSTKLNSYFSNNIITTDNLGGATNIHYKATQYKSGLCNIYCYLDNDDTGRKAIQRAQDRGSITASDYNLSSVQGMSESEIEDLINLDSYRDEVINEFGVDLKNPKFRTNSKKWSDRVKEIFSLNGKIWDDNVEKELKTLVANCVKEKGISTLNSHKENSINSLVMQLEKKLDAR